MTCKIQWQKRVSLGYCINQYAISDFVSVLNHWLFGLFKTDLSDFTLPVKHLKILDHTYLNAHQWQNHENFLCKHQSKFHFYWSYLYEVLLTCHKVRASSLHEKLKSPNPDFPHLLLIIGNQTLIWDPLLL